MTQYSFIENPINNLHKYVGELIPGIEKIVSIYFNEFSNQLESKLSERKKKAYSTSTLDVSENEKEIQELRSSKSLFEWYSKEDIPIKLNSKKLTSPLTIFAERNNIVLLIKFPNPSDGKNDLVYLYFKENFGNFGLSSDDKWLTTENKSIIAHILSNAIRTYLIDKYNDRQALQTYNAQIQRIHSEIDILKDKLEKARENYGLSILKLCEQYLFDLGKRFQKTYHFSDGATKKIKRFNGELKDLETIMLNTVTFLNNLYFDQVLIIISEWYIDYDNLPEVEQSANIPETGSKYIKTIQLLDKLEKAANSLKLKHIKLTSVNIGKALENPISAPAISDALYNHKGKINTLLRDHPEKWLTIRTEFRPLRNIIA
jgi:hypothetical protein